MKNCPVGIIVECSKKMFSYSRLNCVVRFKFTQMIIGNSDDDGASLTNIIDKCQPSDSC